MKWLAFFGLIVVAVCLIGCASTAPKVKEQAHLPSFDFNPPSTASPGSANVTFGIVNSRYSENESWVGTYPFNDFSKNLSLDFQEILGARGFTVRGPFQTYDDITFPDKKGCDLTLQTTIEARPQITDVAAHEKFQLVGEKSYKYDGNVTVSGRVTLSVNESLTNERMWFKSIDIPRKTLPWKTQKAYGPNASAQLFYSDPGFFNPLASMLEEAYSKLMQTAWDYLNPEEMALLKKQAEEIKAKKVYQ